MNDRRAATPQPGALETLSGFRDLVGYRTAAWRENYAEVELQIGSEHGNRIGRAHGGVYATILDAAMGHAAAWCGTKGHIRHCVTLSLTTHFLEGVSTGTIKAIGQVEHIENRIATCSGPVISDRGHVLALGQGSFRYFPGSEHVTGVP